MVPSVSFMAANHFDICHINSHVSFVATLIGYCCCFCTVEFFFLLGYLLVEFFHIDNLKFFSIFFLF